MAARKRMLFRVRGSPPVALLTPLLLGNLSFFKKPQRSYVISLVLLAWEL